MIFARSINGLSHCEQEYSTPEDLEAGANVLLLAALRLAGVEGERTSSQARVGGNRAGHASTLATGRGPCRCGQ